MDNYTPSGKNRSDPNKNDELQKVVDASNERKYFTMIPNLVDDLGLSIQAFRLYFHLRRVAGEEGQCWQSTTTLSQACKTGRGSITRAKAELQAQGLIQITVEKSDRGLPHHVITIVDIWPRNIRYFISTPQVQISTPGEHISTTSGLKEELLKKNIGRKIAPENGKGQEKKDGKTRGSSLASFPVSSNHHPNVELFKQVTGRYPSKTISPEIEGLGEIDKERLLACYGLWEKCGYNPMNIAGWLFDWYQHGIPDDYASSSEYKVAGRPSPANIPSEVYGITQLLKIDGFEDITDRRLMEERLSEE